MDDKQLIESLKFSRSCLDYELYLFNFYVYGELDTKFSYPYSAVGRRYIGGSYSFMGSGGARVWPHNYFKSDETPGAIVEKATTSFLDAVLPRRDKSITVNYNLQKEMAPKKNIAGNNHAAQMADESIQSSYDKLGKFVTKIIQDYLSSPTSTFEEAISIAIRSYLEVGYCGFLVDSNDVIRGFEPENVWFIKSPNRKKIDYALFESMSYDLAIAKWLEEKGIDTQDFGLTKESWRERNIQHLFIRQEGDRYIEKVFLDTNIKEIFSEEYEYCPFFVATQSHYYNGYGRGNGLRSLSAVIQANRLTTNILKANELMTRPPYLINQSYSYRTRKYHENDSINNRIDLSPGSINSVIGSEKSPVVDVPVGSLIQNLVDPSKINLEGFYTMYNDMINRIERIHAIDILTMQSSNSTATEVREQAGLRQRQFRGLVTNFYSVMPKFLHYIFERLEKNGAFEEVQKSDEFKRVKSSDENFDLKNFSVKIMSFEHEIEKLTALELVQMKVQMKAALKDMPPEEAESLMSEINEAML